MKSIILFSILSHLSLNLALANTENKKFLFKDLSLSAGNWYDYVGGVQTDKNGSTKQLYDLEFTPYIAISADYQLSSKWAIIPEIGYVIRREAGESKITKDLYFIRSDVAYLLSDNWRLRAGVSAMFLSIASSGGEETLKNGNSTETYYRPEERSTSINATFDLGAEYKVGNMSGRFHTYIFSPSDELKRKYTCSLSFNYHIPFEDLL